MKKELMELMKKKGVKETDPLQHKARGNMLDALKKYAEGEMGKDVAGLKKVTVAAPNSEGLKEGLDKAEEMVSGEEESEEEEASEMSDELPATPEECDEMIKKLEMKKLMLQKGE